jgi:hypothetical protein
MKTKLYLLLACSLWIFSCCATVAGQIYEFDFNPEVGSISISGNILLDNPPDISGSAADIDSWNITADGLNWTPATSYIAPVTLENDLTWDASNITSLSIELVSYTNAPWYNTDMWGPQLLNLWESGVNDGAGGGLTEGTWVETVPEPRTSVLSLMSMLVCGGYPWLRGRCMQRNKF